ncbi:hypothetical protein [Aurantimonas sp. VKM B-3413]|uniref:hypothetical protein n=1 Tax=Aurantimonas sp. VKM B-3413 TaxID=2779401 RepID=UPI001E45ACBD|nr:hypothetical protein [Aurantimonas sp. VKM B-3413]MCB8840784.1 hypothetical protein [Aurantimonas sp. VKM B-3413]
MPLLKSIHTDGIVELSDGVRYRVLKGQGDLAGRWLEGTDITVRQHPERAENEVHLDNPSAGEGVEAIRED